MRSSLIIFLQGPPPLSAYNTQCWHKGNFQLFQPDHQVLWTKFKTVRFVLCIFPQASQVAQVVKNPPTNAGDTGLIPGSGRSPGGGNDNPLQDSWLGNPINTGAWRAAVRRVTESHTRLSDWARTTVVYTCVIATETTCKISLCFQKLPSFKVIPIILFWSSLILFSTLSSLL